MEKYEWISNCPNNASCVEVMELDEGMRYIRVKGDQNGNRRVIFVTADEWRVFAEAVKKGFFD